MKKLIVAFVFIFASISVFAGELDGTFENGSTKVIMIQTVNAISGSLESNGVVYVLSGKVDNGIAYVEVINGTNKLMGNITVSVLASGEMVINVVHSEHDFGVSSATKLTKK